MPSNFANIPRARLSEIREEEVVVPTDALCSETAFAKFSKGQRNTPEGAASVLLCALLVYSLDPALGGRLLVWALHPSFIHSTLDQPPQLSDSDVQYLGDHLKDRPGRIARYIPKLCGKSKQDILDALATPGGSLAILLKRTCFSVSWSRGDLPMLTLLVESKEQDWVPIRLQQTSNGWRGLSWTGLLGLGEKEEEV